MKDSTVTKADLVEEVIRITELPRKESEIVVETIFESIIQALQTGEKIEIRGFGSFRTRQRRGRTGRNPKTGAKVEVPPKRIPFFKPSKELKDFVNNAYTKLIATAADRTSGNRSRRSIASSHGRPRASAALPTARTAATRTSRERDSIASR